MARLHFNFKKDYTKEKIRENMGKAKGALNSTFKRGAVTNDPYNIVQKQVSVAPPPAI